MGLKIDDQQLKELHSLLMRRMQKKAPDFAVTEDIVQESIYRIIKHAKLEKIDNIEALAHRIASNLLVDHYRQRARMSHTPIEETVIALAPSAEETVDGKTKLRQFEQRLMEMPRKRRDVFIRRRIQGQSHDTIANELKITPRAVEAHISRALKDLAELKDSWEK